MFWRKPYDRGTALATAEKAKAAGRVRKAVKWYRKVLEKAPTDPQVCSKIAPLYAKLGKHQESRAAFDVAADGFLAQGFVPKAIAVWTVAAQTYPEQVRYWERIANEQVMRGCKADAVAALMAGRTQLRKRRHRPLAVMLLRQVLELEPGRVEVTLDLADLLRREGGRDEARQLLKTALLRVGRGRLRRKVRFMQFRVEPSFIGALDWALAR
ncbi:MAG TPA: tetratricopeptide repeat protein [Myxococcales bacterium]|nr:tetratricopeptide repeat protein [Myxococcales bacterium]